MELAINVIERAWRRLVAHRGADRLAADDTFEAHGPHQANCNRAAGHIEASPLQLPPDLADPVDPEVRLRNARRTSSFKAASRLSRADSREDRGPPRHGRDRSVGKNRQHPAEGLDPMRLAVIVDEGNHGLNRRSRAPPGAKYALALRRISGRPAEARGSSRSRAFSFGPPHPWEHRRAHRCGGSAFFTHSCSVPAVQPILGGDRPRTAAQREACSPS